MNPMTKVFIVILSFLCTLHAHIHDSGYIKTHGSELRGQEEAAVRDERVSYLHIALL